jgi:hypothetical protein
MRTSVYLVVAIAGLAALPGCPLVEADAEVQDTCVHYAGLQMPAVPPAAVDVDQSFTVDQLDQFATLAKQGFKLSFESATVTATSGVTDFEFVTHVAMDVASGDPSSTLPTLKMFDCEGCATASDTLEVASSDPGDAAPYVESGSLSVTIDLAGKPPAKAWTIDADVCMRGTASYQYSE